MGAVELIGFVMKKLDMAQTQFPFIVILAPPKEKQENFVKIKKAKMTIFNFLSTHHFADELSNHHKPSRNQTPNSADKRKLKIVILAFFIFTKFSCQRLL
jgi:hypothetical protein